jgi:hypothetical protein
MTNKRIPVDPDIWTVLTLLVAAVSMVAQLAGLRAGQRPKGLRDRNTSLSYEKMRDELELAIRNAERLIRLLQKSSGEPVDPLGEEFTFGASRMLALAPDLQRYRELTQQIALNAGNLSTWTLNLIQIDSGFAEENGNRIMIDAGNVQQRINSLFRERHTNQEVLDECLLLLRSFNQLLGNLDQHRN